MKKLFPILLGCFAFAIVSCGGDDCQTCTGEDADGVAVDVTLCDNGDGTTTSTNNDTNETETDSISLTDAVAIFTGLGGLECK